MINFEDYRFLDSVPGFLRWEEGCQLLEWAATWPAQGDIVELGSFKGRSTVFLGSGACISNKIVYAIDHFKGSVEHIEAGMSHEPTLDYGADLFPQFQQNISRCGLLGQVEAHKGDHAPWGNRSVIGYNYFIKEISFLFIDGEHDYHSTKANFEHWLPEVVSGGLIVFHDDDLAHPGVQKAVSEITFERIDAPKSLAAFIKP